MFVPVTPVITATTHHERVIHKTIVYNDTVLNLNSLGKNLKLTSIYDIEESSLNDCLTTIFNANPDVTFNTIQYSRLLKKVYFYADAYISTSEWEEKKYHTQSPPISAPTLVDELDNICMQEDTKSIDCISIYDLLVTIRKHAEKKHALENEYKSKINALLKDRFYDSYVCIHGFDDSEIKISVYMHGKWENFYFTKQYDDFFISKSTSSLYADDILSLIGTKVSELHEKFLALPKIPSMSISCLNHNFDTYLSEENVYLYSNVQDFHLHSKHVSSFDHDYSTILFSCDCNSLAVNNFVKGKEELIFKKVFVKIHDLPKDIQDELYEVRVQQLEEQTAKRMEESKKQRRLATIRKFFPFIKG